MKNTFKRIAAFAITLCMLLSVVPAVAFAEEPAQESHVEYDFDLLDRTYEYAEGDIRTFANINITSAITAAVKIKQAMNDLYDNGDINWNYHSVGMLEGSTSDYGFTFATNQDLKYNLHLRAGASGTQVAGGYFAMTIKSPGTGSYKLTLDYGIAKSGALAASAYVIPASAGSDIAGALEYYEALGSFSSMSTSSTTVITTDPVTFNNTVEMKAGKDYILVLTTDEASTAQANRASLYLEKVALDLQEPAQNLDTIEYNFEAARTEFAASATVNLAATAGAATNTTINERYAAGAAEQTWKFHSTGNTAGGSATAVNFSLNKGTATPGAQLVTAGYKNNAYYAVTVRSPGSGDYALTLNYWTHSTGASKGSVYVLPGDTADIAAAVAAATAVGTFNSDSGVTKFNDPEALTMGAAVSMEAGAEYLLVFTADEYAARGDRATLYIHSVELNRIVSMDEIEYNFDLGNIKDAAGGDLMGNGTDFYGRNVVGTNASAVNRQNAIKNYYADGVINWYYHSTNGTTFSTAGSATVYRGITMQDSSNAMGKYFATVIRSPGPGTYTMTVNVWDSYYGASAASIYLLPVDTTDIAAAVAAGTAVGTFDCDGPNKNFAADSTTFDVTLGAGEEYLMVFKNDESSVNYPAASGTRATLYVDSIVLTNKAAGGSEEVSGDYIADGKSFVTFEEAVAAAYDADDLAVKLNADVAMDELIVPANLSIDLNGKTLTVDALSGSVTDSSAGNTGLLAAERDTIVFSAKNADAPLWDAAAGGYRFFDYLLEVFDEAEAVEGKPSSQKFWFKFHFYTDDACAELDQDAYALVAGGNSGFKVATHMSWNGEALPSVYYGIDGDVDAFSRGWATDATASRWLYIRVDGLDEDLYGTLRVKPELEVNGVLISNTVVTYTNEAPETAE